MGGAASKVAVSAESRSADHGYSHVEVFRAWLPWTILSVLVFIWGIPAFKQFMDGLWVWKYPIPTLHELVTKGPPVVAHVEKEPVSYRARYARW